MKYGKCFWERSIFKTIAYLIAVGLFLVLHSCGSDEAEEEYIVPVSFVSASYCSKDTITVAFDGEPRDVIVSAGTVTVSGKTATITGPFASGPLQLTITWSDGTQGLNYFHGCD